MKLKKAVFLDFDGVLFDTVKEAFAVCLLATGRSSRPEEIDYATEDYRIFRKLRYLIGPAWNYLYLLKVTEEAKTSNIANPEDRYLDYIAQAKAPDYKDFEESFFSARESLKRKHEDLWLKLNSPYGFLFSLENLVKKYPGNFFIVTTKDTETVLKLLNFHGLDFSRKNIYGKESLERFKTKQRVISNIMDEYSIDDAIFVDDNKLYLSSCSGLAGVKVLQSEWGYIPPGDETGQSLDILSLITELLEGAKTCMG